MLHSKTLPASTLDLLKRLSAHPALEEFALVGGTCLALRYRHRLSMDLDFFTPNTFDGEALAEDLGTEFPNLATQKFNSNGFAAFIDDMKVDFVTYRYPLLAPPETIEGIRMLSLQDVVARKLGAITNRGAKKDFYDLYTLIGHLGLPELVRIYKLKFPKHDPMIVLRSMIYFDDAEDEDEPESLTGVTWDEVKDFIREAIRTTPMLQ